MFSRTTWFVWPRFGWTSSRRFITRESTTSWETPGTSVSGNYSGTTCAVKGFRRGGGTMIRQSRLDNFSFSWYLENIYPELFVPTQALHQGSLRSAVSGLCLTIPRGRKKDLINKAVTVQPCKHFPNPRWNIQTWHYSSR